MRWSSIFIPTLRETPAEAEVISHQLLLRAGFIRQLAAGVYSYLPLAQRSLVKITQILREEFGKIGGQEFYLPALQPAELWQESGRWEIMGPNMFRLKDRVGRDMGLGMTHEEVFTDIARNNLRSYKDLPQIWYQIQVKFRDEPRPRAGLLRTRQFTMKDSYSFDVDYAGLDVSYQKHAAAYAAVFRRCGLEFTVVEAHSGSMGGSQSQEFMVKTDEGEDLIATCACGYAANLERAESVLPAVSDDDTDQDPVPVHTPGQKSIEEVSAFLKISPQRLIKSLIFIVESQPVLVLLRGDHQANEAKLGSAFGTSIFRPATSGEIQRHFGAEPGSIGPVGVHKIRIIADAALKGRRHLTAGANQTDFHLQHVTPEKHFEAEFADLRSINAGEACVRCGQPLRLTKALEIGHIFKLGTKYSDSMGAHVLTHEGKSAPIVMGSYGIGLERLLVAAVQQNHDEQGIIWPIAIAPFEVVLTLVSLQDRAQVDAAHTLYDTLRADGVEALLDDRDDRPGVKFKDADLIGMPFRVTVGQKMKTGKVEIYDRKQRQAQEVPVEDAARLVIERVRAARAALVR